MFSNDKNQMETLVKNRKWDKIGNKLHGATAQSRLDCAVACGDSSEEDALHVLIKLLNDSDENVQIQEIKSLGAIGGENAKKHLRYLSEHLPDGKNFLISGSLNTLYPKELQSISRT